MLGEEKGLVQLAAHNFKSSYVVVLLHVSQNVDIVREFECMECIG